MSAALGAYLFDALLGPPPRLPQLGIDLFTRPGNPGTGARLLPATGMESSIDLVRIVASADRVSTGLDYRAAVGSIVAFQHAGIAWNTTHGFNFLILDVSIRESSVIPHAIGIDPAGTPYDHAPAGRIVSHWVLTPIPA